MTPIRDYARTLEDLIGTQGAEWTVEVEKGAIAKFARAVGETNPLYFDAEYAASTRFGGIVAPPTFVAVLKGPGLPKLPDPPVEMRVFLHTDDVIRSFRPIRVGDVITSTPRLVDVSVKDGRSGELLFTSFTYDMTDSADELVSTLTWTEVQSP